MWSVIHMLSKDATLREADHDAVGSLRSQNMISYRSAKAA
jgi:hypothetical protein